MKFSPYLPFLYSIFFAINLMAQSDIELKEYANGFITPVDIANAGDERLFVVEQRGLIKIVQPNGSVLERPFLNIQNRIAFGGEKGLLGIAFHPEYENNGLLYVNYSNPSGDTHIASFKVSDDPNLVNSATEQILLTINQPFGNHNGGCLKFGPDGFLYIGLGDGGSARDPQNNSQNNNSLLGKMLRIDVADGNTYGIPTDNPFINNPNIPDEIWATGLRNPWRFSFDRLTDDLWIADVGQNSFEEINKVTIESEAGINFGWRCYEGNVILNDNGCINSNQFQYPVFTYPTILDFGLSITGGYVYRGVQNPNLYGKYIYGDFISGRIWALTSMDNGEYDNQEISRIGFNEISTFGENETGELFMAAYSSGKIYKIEQTFSTSTEIVDNLAQVLIIPNPVKEQFEVQIHTKNEVAIKLELVNLIGTIVQTKEQIINDQTSISFDIKDLSPSTYFLRISDERKIITRKIIKY